VQHEYLKFNIIFFFFVPYTSSETYLQHLIINSNNEFNSCTHMYTCILMYLYATTYNVSYKVRLGHSVLGLPYSKGLRLYVLNVFFSKFFYFIEKKK
jgi:hypothetical protein